MMILSSCDAVLRVGWGRKHELEDVALIEFREQCVDVLMHIRCGVRNV